MVAEPDIFLEKKPENGTLALFRVGRGATHYFAVTNILVSGIRQSLGLK